MKLFKIVYIVVAILGSALIYFAAPLARPFLQVFIQEEEPVNVVAEDSRFDPDSDLSPVKIKINERTSPAKVKSVTPEADDYDDPPALMGIFRASGREKPTWGIIQTKTSFYGEDGIRLGELPTGVVVAYKELRVSSKGKMVVCTLHYKGKNLGPYLMKPDSLCLFTGDYTKLSETQRANLEAYYKMKGILADRETELMQQMAEKNPHYSLYKAAYDQYMAHIDEAKEISMKRDKSEGPMRSRYDDKLRRMKNEETVLQKKYNEIHAKYKGWKLDNAASLPDASKDAKVREYRNEMHRLAPLIPGLAY